MDRWIVVMLVVLVLLLMLMLPDRSAPGPGLATCAPFTAPVDPELDVSAAPPRPQPSTSCY